MRMVTHYISIHALQADALFASGLQRRDEPGADQVQQAVAAAIRAFGPRGLRRAGGAGVRRSS